MSAQLLTDKSSTPCGFQLDTRIHEGRERGNRNSFFQVYVACTRPLGHAPTGHEFVGEIAGVHLHLVWGEP